MSEEWISITDAARRLSAAGDVVDRSSLSRYISQHSDALVTRREGKSNLIEFTGLEAHRRENIRLKRVEPSSPVVAAPSAAQANQNTAVLREKEATAALKELDLAQKLGLVTPVSEVIGAAHSAIAKMRSAFERQIEPEAQSLALKYGWDERQTRLALKTFAAAGLDEFHRELLTVLASSDANPTAEQAQLVETPTLQ